jgi:hypothetical protein
VTEQIRPVLKDSFKKSFQSLHGRCKSCIDWQEDYVEHWGNKCFLPWIFYFLLTQSRNFIDALCIC